MPTRVGSRAVECLVEFFKVGGSYRLSVGKLHGNNQTVDVACGRKTDGSVVGKQFVLQIFAVKGVGVVSLLRHYVAGNASLTATVATLTAAAYFAVDGYGRYVHGFACCRGGENDGDCTADRLIGYKIQCCKLGVMRLLGNCYQRFPFAFERRRANGNLYLHSCGTICGNRYADHGYAIHVGGRHDGYHTAVLQKLHATVVVKTVSRRTRRVLQAPVCNGEILVEEHRRELSCFATATALATTALTAARRFRPLGVNHNVACECLGYSPRGRALCVGVPSAKHFVAVLRSCRQLEIAVKRNNYRTCTVLCVKHHVVARCYGRFRPFGVDGDVSRQRLGYSPRCCALCVGVPSAKHFVTVLRSCRQLETAVEFDSCRRRAVLRIECYGVHRGSACRKHQNQRKNYCQKSRNFSFHVVPPK